MVIDKQENVSTVSSEYVGKEPQCTCASLLDFNLLLHIILIMHTAMLIFLIHSTFWIKEENMLQKSPD